MNPELTKRPDEIRCLWCGQLTPIVWVHGHGQCTRCGTNIDECCRGESNSDGCQRPLK